jgi:hypothetical protein
LISARTAESHLGKVVTKVGIASRAERAYTLDR